MSLPTNPTERLRALDAAPYTSGGGMRTLTVTGADASITLAPGGYTLCLGGSIDGVGCIGSAASVPASGDLEVAGAFALPAGAVVTIDVAESDGALHAILSSAGTSTLWITRVL